MKKIFIVLLCAMCFVSCNSLQTKRLQRKMVPLAKQFLKDDGVKDYKALKIDCVDTITEVSYAKLTSELLAGMEDAYSNMAYSGEGNTEVISLYLRDIERTKADMDDLLESGDLQTEGVLLYMVTASYEDANGKQNFFFLVNPDKKTLHTLDPFGNNLLYEE